MVEMGNTITKTINLLLVEDNPVDARLIQELLRDAPHERFHIVTMSTLAATLNFLAENDVDVVLLDLGLPDSQGLATFEAVYERAPNVPIIMFTSLDGEEFAAAALRQGAQDYLTKETLSKDEITTALLVRAIGYAIERKRAEEEISASLRERETLLKEIHHRVKNNLQIVSGLLSLQAAKATEPETLEILDESQRRIKSMALIHEKLYRSSSLAEIDFGDYIKSLIDELRRMYNVADGVITITVEIENVQLGVDTAIPCALIVNELVSNSLKHAFPDGPAGEVTIALQRANGAHTLTVADNGVGFPADLDFRTTDSLGMQLVVTLVNQLDGTITLDRTKGTTFIITFKPEGAQAPSARYSSHL